MNEQPKALRLADIMDTECGGPISLTIELRRLHEENENMRKVNDFLRNRRGKSNYPQTTAAAELRRLHEVNSELVQWLTVIRDDIAGDRKLRERFGVSFLAALESSIRKAKGKS